VENRESRPRFARALLQNVRGTFWLDRRPRTGGWRWTASLAVMFAIGLLLGAVRVITAWGAALALRRRSKLVRDGQMLDLLASLQAQLGATRRIELREIAWLSAPATLGWRRPVILLPGDWRFWSEEERRAVLAHEIAHVERGDYLMWLAAQLALALHFYHPAVHWLAARIRLEQEFAADAMAASLAGGRRAYLTTLARFTLRASAPPRALAPSFISNRGMLLARIDRLRRLETNAPPVNRWTSRFVALAILIAATTVASGFRGPSIWLGPARGNYSTTAGEQPRAPMQP
jgi:beta-lactamase regulating signal transducer with metallopeptidase domain